MAIFTVDILFIVVIVFVVFATTFVCQIFGKMTAEKVFESLNQNDEETEINEKTFIVKNRNKKSTSNSSLSSYNESNYVSPELRKLAAKRRGRRKKSESENCCQNKNAVLCAPARARHEKRSKFRRRVQKVDLNSSDDSWTKRREERMLLNRVLPIFPDHNFIGQLSGTFGRLGIPGAEKIEEKIPERMHSFFKQLEDKNLSPLYQSSSMASDSDNQVPPLGLKFLRRQQDSNIARRIDFNQESTRDSLLQASENNNNKIARGFQVPGAALQQVPNEKSSEMSMKTGSNSVFFSENANEKSPAGHVMKDQITESLLVAWKKSRANNNNDVLVKVEPPSPEKNLHPLAAGYRGPFTTPLSADKAKLQVFLNSGSTRQDKNPVLQFFSASRCASCPNCRQNLVFSPGHTA